MSEWIADGLIVLIFVGAYFLGRALNRPGPGGADPKETRP